MQVKRQSIAHNTGWLSGVNLLIKPLSFVFIILATRLLGPDDFGKFAFTTSIVSFIYVFFEGGINIHTVRSISADKDNFDNNFYLQLFLKAGGGLLTGIAAIIFLLFTNYESTIVYLTLIAIIFIIFNALMLHLRMYFRAFEVMKYESYSIAFEKFGLILICGSLLFISQNVVLFTAFYAITYFITFLYTLVLLIKVIGRPKFHFPLSRIYNDVIVPASPFALMNILITGRASAGTLLLKFIKQKDTSVGYYSAPYRLLSSFLLFPNMITKPLLPVIVRIQERMRYVKRLLNSTARFLLGIAALVAFPLFLLHKPITILLFGPSFAPAATTLSIIALNMIPAALIQLASMVVAATNRQNEVNKLFIFETITTIVLYGILIYFYSYIGAAVASIIGDTIYLSINFWVVRDYIRGSGIFTLLVKLVLILMIITFYQATPFFPANHILGFIVVIALILAGLFGLQIIRKHEIRNLQKMFHDMFHSK